MSVISINKTHNQKRDSRWKIAVTKLARFVAKSILFFNIRSKDFIQILNRQIVLEAKKQYPNYSKVKLAARTGIDRRYIDQYGKEEEDYYPSKVTKDIIVMNMIRHFCFKNKVNKILKSGAVDSFHAYCLRAANGTFTPGAIATELIRQELIVEEGDYYTLNPDSTNLGKTDKSEVEVFQLEVNRLINTFETNSAVEEREDLNNQEKSNLKLCQRNIYSNKIPPEKRAWMAGVITQMQLECQKSIEKFLDSHEIPKNLCTEPAIGASFFSWTDDNQDMTKYNLGKLREAIEKEKPDNTMEFLSNYVPD